MTDLSLLNEIIKIEKQADTRLKAANKELQKIDQSLELKKESIKKNIKQKAENKLECAKQTEKKIFDEKIIKIKSDYDVECKRLEKIYKENINNWVKNLKLKVISNFVQKKQ